MGGRTRKLFLSSLQLHVQRKMQTPSTLLAQAHANAANPHTPHREHRSRDHGHRRSRQPNEAQSPSSPLVLAPSPAVVKNRRAGAHEGSRGGSREHISVQPLAPTSRRASQQRVDRDSTLVAAHPYATANSQSPYRSTAYGRNSPVQPGGLSPLLNGNGAANALPNQAESYMYSPQQPGKGLNSREGTATGTNGKADAANGARGINMYERDQMARVGEQDEHGLGRKSGFWAAFCCRA